MAARDWEPRRWRYALGVPIGLLGGGFLFLKLVDVLLG